RGAHVRGGPEPLSRRHRGADPRARPAQQGDDRHLGTRLQPLTGRPASVGAPAGPAAAYPERSPVMKWITRERVKVDRVACPWLIRKFVDREAEFLFVPADQVMAEAEREGAIPYDVKDVELGHHGKECSFEAIVKKYRLTGDPALMLLARIVNGADTDNSLYDQPESAGLNPIAEGLRHLGFMADLKLDRA